MGGTTTSQALRYPYVDDIIAETAQGNLGADIAAKLTTQDTARNLVIKRPNVLIRRGANLSLVDGTDTAIIWDNVQDDPYSLVNLGTFPTRVTPGAGNVGIWRFTLNVGAAGPNTWTKAQVSVAVTGTTKQLRTYFSSGNGPAGYTFAGLVQVPTGTDYIEMKIKHNGGGTTNIFGLEADFCQWSA
jgi:hypothetical protein